MEISTETWVFFQIAVDLALIALFVMLVKQLKLLTGNGDRGEGYSAVSKTLEPVLREAKETADQFDRQLKEKQLIVRSLNERLDSRIISLTLLLNRAEAGFASPQSTPMGGSDPIMDGSELQQQIVTLATNGTSTAEAARRLGISEGEVKMVLDLKRKFQEMKEE